MPFTKKGKKIMSSMKSEYGDKKGEQVFYASRNKGVISGVDKGFYGHPNPIKLLKRNIHTSGHLEGKLKGAN